MVTGTNTKVRSFGAFTLDLGSGELRQKGLRVRLQPKPMKLLVLLTSRPGELVTREEIQRELWAEDTFVNFENGLNFAINQVRTALRDTSVDPIYIETVPKRGYRFVAPVAAAPETDTASPGKDLLPPIEAAGKQEPRNLPVSRDLPLAMGTAGSVFVERRAGERRVSRAPGTRWGRVAWTAAVLAGCVLVFAALRWYRARHWQPQKPVAAVIVLPFENLTGDPAKEYISDGMTEEVISRLATTGGEQIRVIARTSSMSFKRSQLTIGQIGGAVQAQYVLEGSLRTEGDQIRVTAQLLRTADQSHLWSHSFNGSADQILSFEDRIAQAIVDALPLRYQPELQPRRAVAAVAHEKLLEGQERLRMRSREDLLAALRDYGAAVAADPKYARAYASMAITYNLLGQYGWMEESEAGPLGKAAAAQAIALDDSIAEAHAAMGFNDWFYGWDWTSAEKEFRRAIELNPSNVDASHWYALSRATAGDMNQGAELMQTALRLDPRSLIVRTNVGWIQYMARDYSAAEKTMLGVLKDNPDFASAHIKLWYLYSTQHRDTDAFRQVESILPIGVDSSEVKSIEEAGEAGGYAAGLNRWIAATSGKYHANYTDRARAELFAGDQDKALASLQAGLKAHEGWMVFVPSDPAFDALRSRPAMRTLEKAIRSHPAP